MRGAIGALSPPSASWCSSGSKSARIAHGPSSAPRATSSSPVDDRAEEHSHLATHRVQLACDDLPAADDMPDAQNRRKRAASASDDACHAAATDTSAARLDQGGQLGSSQHLARPRPPIVSADLPDALPDDLPNAHGPREPAQDCARPRTAARTARARAAGPPDAPTDRGEHLAGHRHARADADLPDAQDRLEAPQLRDPTRGSARPRATPHATRASSFVQLGPAQFPPAACPAKADAELPNAPDNPNPN